MWCCGGVHSARLFIYLSLFESVARAYTYIRTLRIYIYTYSRPRQIANAAQPLAAYNIVENLIFKLHMHYYRVHSALCSVFNLGRPIIRLIIIIILNVERAGRVPPAHRATLRTIRFGFAAICRRYIRRNPTHGGQYYRFIMTLRCYSAYYNYYILYCCCCCYYNYYCQ